jgi:hypothetical protein
MALLDTLFSADADNSHKFPFLKCTNERPLLGTFEMPFNLFDCSIFFLLVARPKCAWTLLKTKKSQFQERLGIGGLQLAEIQFARPIKGEKQSCSTGWGTAP